MKTHNRVEVSGSRNTLTTPIAPTQLSETPLSTESVQYLEDGPEPEEILRLRQTSSPLRVRKTLTLPNGLEVEIPEGVDPKDPAVMDFLAEVAGQAT